MSFFSKPASLSPSLLHPRQEEKDRSVEGPMEQSQDSRMGPPWSQEVSGLCYDTGVISSISKVLQTLFDSFLHRIAVSCIRGLKKAGS